MVERDGDMKKRLSEFKYRKLMLAVADAFIIAISALIASNVFDLLDDGIRTGMLWANIAVTVMTCLASLALLGAYSRLWRYFNKKDYISCICGVIFGITASCLFAYIFHDGVFVRYSMLQCLIAVCGICTFRFIFKCTFIDLVEAGRNEAKYKRTMIIGGGQACKMLLSEIRNAQNSPYTEDKSTAVFDPLCIIDDDRSKIGKAVYDVQIVGTTAEISKFISEFKIEQIIFCIPSCLEDERYVSLIFVLLLTCRSRLYLSSEICCSMKPTQLY